MSSEPPHASSAADPPDRASLRQCGANLDVIAKAFASGHGVPWGDHNPDLVEGTLRFFRGNYLTNLVPAWLPAIDGVEAGVSQRCRFEVATAKEYPGSGYGLVTVFDALHDMGDPAGAAAHVHEALDPDGTWMIVEPFAHDRLEDNVNPVGRVFYSASTLMCLPVPRSQEVDAALGAQAGEARLRRLSPPEALPASAEQSRHRST